MGSMVLAWLVSVSLGGWKFGNLRRRIEVEVDAQQVNAFVERVTRRVFELKFIPANVLGRYTQGVGSFEPLGVHAHAKTRKQLDIALDQSVPTRPKVLVTLQYLDPILGDTGEGAYRDAVLEYVTGQSDVMKIVPNRSFAAVCSFAGGIVACATLLVLKAMHVRVSVLLELVLMVGVTFAVTGVMAVIGIHLKKGQAIGTAFAITGIITSSVAVAGAVVLKVTGAD